MLVSPIAIRDGSKFMGYSGRDLRQGAKTLFRKIGFGNFFENIFFHSGVSFYTQNPSIWWISVILDWKFSSTMLINNELCIYPLEEQMMNLEKSVFDSYYVFTRISHMNFLTFFHLLPIFTLKSKNMSVNRTTFITRTWPKWSLHFALFCSIFFSDKRIILSGIILKYLSALPESFGPYGIECD